MISSTATTTPPTSPSVIQELVHRKDWKAGVLGTLNALTLILAVRLTLLVAVCGAAVLAYLVLQGAEPYRLGVLGIYTGVVVVPLIWLAARR